MWCLCLASFIYYNVFEGHSCCGMLSVFCSLLLNSIYNSFLMKLVTECWSPDKYDKKLLGLRLAVPL